MGNRAIVMELYRAFREADHAAFAALCAPDLEWIQNDGFPGGGRHRGAAAVINQVFKAFDRTWERFSFSIETIHDAGDAVIVTGRYEGQHRVTGKSFNAAAAHVYELSGGRLTRYRQFADTRIIWEATV